jgi:hypothetical protein
MALKISSTTRGEDEPHEINEADRSIGDVLEESGKTGGFLKNQSAYHQGCSEGKHNGNAVVQHHDERSNQRRADGAAPGSFAHRETGRRLIRGTRFSNEFRSSHHRPKNCNSETYQQPGTLPLQGHQTGATQVRSWKYGKAFNSSFYDLLSFNPISKP